MKILDFLYPIRCPLCEKTIKRSCKGYPLCNECYESQKINKKAKAYKPDFLPENDILYCLYSYTDSLRSAVIKYKFSGEIWLAKPFAEMMIDFIEESGGIHKIDYITNIPVSGKTFAVRGYDQAYEIAKIIAQKTNTKYVSCFVKNESASDNAVMKKNREQRMNEKRYAFSGRNIRGKSFLLIDDILTTGSTIRECTRLLFENGALKVNAAVIASGRQDI